jgi:hypothetical protein
VAANLLDQNFVANRPNQVWLADITYIPTGEGWLYLAVILDLFTRKAVGWAMRDHMRAELTHNRAGTCRTGADPAPVIVREAPLAGAVFVCLWRSGLAPIIRVGLSGR